MICVFAGLLAGTVAMMAAGILGFPAGTALLLYLIAGQIGLVGSALWRAAFLPPVSGWKAG